MRLTCPCLSPLYSAHCRLSHAELGGNIALNHACIKQAPDFIDLIHCQFPHTYADGLPVRQLYERQLALHPVMIPDALDVMSPCTTMHWSLWIFLFASEKP